MSIRIDVGDYFYLHCILSSTKPCRFITVSRYAVLLSVTKPYYSRVGQFSSDFSVGSGFASLNW